MFIQKKIKENFRNIIVYGIKIYIFNMFLQEQNGKKYIHIELLMFNSIHFYSLF